MSTVDTQSHTNSKQPPVGAPTPSIVVPALNPNDLPVLHSSYHFNSKNYLQWTQVIRTTLKGRRKMSHIVGDPPKTDDPQFGIWDDEDSLIMTWLWNPMTMDMRFRDFGWWHCDGHTREKKGRIGGGRLLDLSRENPSSLTMTCLRRYLGGARWPCYLRLLRILPELRSENKNSFKFRWGYGWILRNAEGICRAAGSGMLGAA